MGLTDCIAASAKPTRPYGRASAAALLPAHDVFQRSRATSLTATAPTQDLDPEAIADRTTVGVFFRQAARYGDKPLIHYRQGDAWQVETWADLRRHVLAVASALIAAGVKPRDSVLLISENRVEWVYCDFAIQTIGAVTVPIYPNSPAELAQTIAADSGATYALASGAPLAAKLEVAGALRHIATMDGEVADWVRLATLSLPE